MAKYKDELLDHDYDGIKEMDNDLPRWWLYLFYLSIVWSVIYFIYYTVMGIGYSQEDLYKQEMNPNYKRIVAADSKIFGVIPQYTTPYYDSKNDLTPRQLMMASGTSKMVVFTAATDTMTYIALSDPGELAFGKELFLKNCAQCHGKFGEGGVGPNLTDDYWLHGADISSIVRSVKYGYPVKGMISWLGTLSEGDIIKTSSYLQTLRGTNPPNARAPQGELVAE
jgi:cytochrome c oxidase cbb3-type subunit 3